MESKKLLVYGEVSERQQTFIDFLTAHGYTVEPRNLLDQYQGIECNLYHSALDEWATYAAEQVAQESLAEVLKPKNDPYYRKESRKGGKRW